ncbi:putative leucine-rich repeat receptor-like serine/threonine-protein kinase At2g19230 [Cucumis melo]|uniref:non-specific serine/threonine protein kinase n=1 Tax=Cucumis melo TaxID=3656 RepID=A0ABM3KM95_CUCME|nr:putative leucine-rich repeat receptor-like serine/threonine-protein kinase At2g19230 [Cucumis melo]
MEIATSIWLLLSSFVLHVQAQDLGFVSLDCGLPANSSGYTDSKTKIKYISDEGFIKAGESSSVAPEFKNNEQSLLTLRSFSRYIRNCYDISASKDTRYLIRASFLYGNYDGLNKTPKFDLYLGNTRWTTVDDSYYYTEMMHTPSIDKLSVCLINIGYGIPFISTLEFRELPYLSYSPLSYSLHLYKRYDMGSMTNQQYRFPDDPYDRVWEIYKDNNYAPLSTLDSVVTDNLEQTPAVVMQTAATSKKGIQLMDDILKSVDAISNIRSDYGVIKNWEADPCLPSGYPWSGLSCSSDPIPRITSLNLSSSELKGVISPYIIGLPMLQTLDLSNNYLTGQVPELLSNLAHLTVLNLENNNLTGSLPPELTKKQKNGSLTLRTQGNPDLCKLDSCTNMTPERKKSNNIIIPAVASVGGLLAFLIIAVIVYWIAKSNKKQQGDDVALIGNPAKAYTQLGSSLETNRRQFTFAEVVMITNNFERVLGKGGFGMVYYGVLDDTEVAVKMISPSAVQGYSQFQAEVTILMRVHHRNLTSLVGYMNDGGHLGLVYEYMAKGNLAEHLSEKTTSILSWEDRLRIAIDAAQGLEYLHHGCKPPIVHRDVKTTNILLTEKFNAKLSDFGLSKTYPTDDKSYMSTIIVGTPGYLDPEYYTSNRLTEKSDVYGFGVSLMEVISCRPVISNIEDPETNYIAKWMRTMVAQRNIKNIVDPRLKEAYESNSIWKAVRLALACVSEDSSERPTMNQVVIELKECLAMELNQRLEQRPLESRIH